MTINQIEYFMAVVRCQNISKAAEQLYITQPALSRQIAAMEEELGIRVDPERFLGQLPTVYTPLGQRTNVYVCTISQEDAAGVRHNPAEVSEVLRVPMTYLLRNPDAASYPFAGHEIWGMTAGAIRHFCAAWARARDTSSL